MHSASQVSVFTLSEPQRSSRALSFSKARARACQPCATAGKKCGLEPPPTPAPKKRKREDDEDYEDEEAEADAKKAKGGSRQIPVVIDDSDSDSDSETSHPHQQSVVDGTQEGSSHQQEWSDKQDLENPIAKIMWDLGDTLHELTLEIRHIRRAIRIELGIIAP